LRNRGQVTEIARFGHGNLVGIELRNLILSLSRIACLLDYLIYLGNFESSDGDVKISAIQIQQILKLDGEN
jgi:hypothetical protein